MALTPLQRHQARSMGMNVNWAEELLSFIGIRPDLANYPMEDYLPEGASLSDENFVQAFDATVAAIQAAGGGILRIPAGTWNLGTSELEVVSAGRNVPVYIEGAGVNITVLSVDVGYEGTVIHLSGEDSLGAEDWYYDGGIANLSITCPTADDLTVGTGIRITSCIGTQFLNLIVRNLQGGIGFQAELGDTSEDTCQYIQMWNVTVAGCATNYKLFSFVNCQGYSIFSTAAVTNDFLCDDAKATFYGGNVQSSASAGCIKLAGTGGCQLVFHDFYYEGFASPIFKLATPSITSNQVAVYNFHLGGTPAVFVDTDAFNDLSLNYVNRVADATVILKARNGATSILLGCSDPVALPLKFDLDAASAAQTIYISNGCVTAAQAKFVPRAAAGVTGPALFVDSTGGALKFKGAGGTVTTLAPT